MRTWTPVYFIITQCKSYMHECKKFVAILFKHYCTIVQACKRKTYAPRMVQHCSHDSLNLGDLIQKGGKSTQHYQIASMRSVRHRKQLAW